MRGQLRTGWVCSLAESHGRSGGSSPWCNASHDDGRKCNVKGGCRAAGTYGFGWRASSANKGRDCTLQPFVCAIVAIVTALRPQVLLSRSCCSSA